MSNVSVFISHSWSYDNHYEKLSTWLFGENWKTEYGTPINFIDTSVPKTDPIHYAQNEEQLKQAIYQRIMISNVVVIPTGMYANYSKWIQKEIDGARLYTKPILAVNPWAQERKSAVVAEVASKQVGWTKQSVGGGVWDLYNGR